MAWRPKRVAAVVWLIEHHRDAVELELIKHGERLRWMGQPRLSWRDVWLICTSAPAGSRLAAELDPRAEWTLIEQMLATVVDSQRWLVWAKTKDGQKGVRMPKPMQRPGAKREPRRVMTTDQMRAFLSAPRRASQS